MRIIFFAFMLMIIGCQTKPKSDSMTDKELDEGETTCTYKADSQSIKAFPFDKADKIELVSYSNRIFTYHSDSLIKDGKFMVPEIKQRVILTEIQADSLNSILYNYRITRKGNVRIAMDCFNPRNSIVFYQNGQAIAFLEVCFECHDTRQTPSVDFGEFCDEKWCMLQKFFKESKVDYQLMNEMCE